MIVLICGILSFISAVNGAQPQYAMHEKLSLRAAKLNARSIPKFSQLELTVDLSAAYNNPFDPEDIDLGATFISPAGKTVHVNGFLDRTYSRRLVGKQEILSPAGPPIWKIRFTPDTVGKWRYRVQAKDRTGSASLKEATFLVSPSKQPGFVRRSGRNPAVFAYSDEHPLFLVGENMGWGGWNGVRGAYDYDTWLAALGKAGGNWVRVWMSSWNCALEWSSDPRLASSEYRGVGEYNLANARKLETILDAAERNGISVMLCFGTYGEFTDGGFFNEGQWKSNPYNAANGGPCAKPSDFWTNSQARKLYRRRLRYITARYGCRTNIHSWEFWNEAQAPVDWVAEMAQFIKGTGPFEGKPADPYGHLLTTSYGNDAVWKLPDIDITQTHHYGKGDVPDHAPVVHDDAAPHRVYWKPHLMAEFGIDWRKGDEQYDPDGLGVNLHNGLWAAAVSGDAGSAMIWWWDGYIHPKNLYGQFTPLRKFADKIPWTAGPMTPLTFEQGPMKTQNANRSSTQPAPLAFYGLSNNQMAVLWVHNTSHNWKNVYEKKPVPTIANAAVMVRGLPSGRYTVEWWDTWRGEVLKRETVRSSELGFLLQLPDITTDVAARIFK